MKEIEEMFEQNCFIQMVENVDWEWRIVMDTLTCTHTHTCSPPHAFEQENYAKKGAKTNKNLWTENNDFPLAIANNNHTRATTTCLYWWCCCCCCCCLCFCCRAQINAIDPYELRHEQINQINSLSSIFYSCVNAVCGNGPTTQAQTAIVLWSPQRANTDTINNFQFQSGSFGPHTGEFVIRASYTIEVHYRRLQCG